VRGVERRGDDDLEVAEMHRIGSEERRGEVMMMLKCIG
jgi:hypothetical protein